MAVLSTKRISFSTRYSLKSEGVFTILFFHYGWLGFPQKGKCHIPELHKGKVDSFLSHLGQFKVESLLFPRLVGQPEHLLQGLN